MRFLGPALLLCLLLASGASHADPARAPAGRRAEAGEQGDRMRFGITAPWSPKRLGRHFGLGLGWSLPQRWYDTDGQLLTERSLLTPGNDLERSGFYLALRF